MPTLPSTTFSLELDELLSPEELIAVLGRSSRLAPPTEAFRSVMASGATLSSVEACVVKWDGDRNCNQRP